MSFWPAYAYLILGSATSAWAAGAGHQASVWDLIAPAVNVGILGIFLIWKLKGPLKNYFDKRSSDVSNTLERANLKSKEAHMMFENEKNKLSNLPEEIKNINKQSEQDVLVFEKKFAKETEEKTHKLKSDANSKILANKKELLDNLNSKLLDQVIFEAKEAIRSNKENQNKASMKLLKGLQ
jgi:F0F1-type ATP synthase membrane subunit b/b'